ncbi:MAG: hypothetical protein HZC02_02425 [Candidatus Levybacteria bacterium]|nr:hypothetical protein [Candidatus Levybacteria bacterium]
MNRQTLKQLVLASYTDSELDARKINKISDLLSKKELKLYIRALKNSEKQNTILLEVPSRNLIDEGSLQDLFPDKRISVSVDPELLVGMRFQDNDDIFEFSLKNTLDKITEHIKEQYD